MKSILRYECDVYGSQNYAVIEVFHLKFMKHVLDVKATTNTAMVYAETGRYPLAIPINLCIIKFWFKILNSDVHKLIHIIYHHVLQQSYLEEWPSHVKKTFYVLMALEKFR